MKYRHNMAYAKPSNLALMKMTNKQLRDLKDAGDAEAAAELTRRKANKGDAEHQEARASRGRMDKRPKSKSEGATQADTAAGPTVAGPAPTTMAEAAAVADVQTTGSAATEATVQAATGTTTVREAQAAQAEARAAEAQAVAATPSAQKKERKKAVAAYTRRRIDLERHYLALQRKLTLEQAVDLYRAGEWPPGRKAATRSNPLPYPGAQVLYPQQGIVQGGTGPFYGPTGTLFDRTPDMLWDYTGAPVRNNGKKRRNPTQILWPRSARSAGVIQGGETPFYGPDGVPFNNYPDLTEKLLLNPRMQDVEVLWPQPESRVGVIQGGSQRYMSYPSAAPFDRMPNLTRTLKNKKRSR
jgi:hypothetical protein